MAFGITPVDHSLWRIAELSSHCSDPSWPGDKEEAWSALQEAIAEVRGLVMETTAAIEAAELRAARAEGRIRVVRRERDRERAARQALRAAAEVAQERAKAAGEQAKASQSQADRAQTALDAALGAREAAETALRWALDRSDDATAARARAEVERDEVQAAYVTLREAKEAAEADGARARSALEAAEAAGEELERTAVLVGEPPETAAATPVAEDERQAVEEDEREPGEDEREPVEDEREPVEDEREPGEDEREPVEDNCQPIVVDISTPTAEAVVGSVERYLHVGATMGHMLPDDFADLLIGGAALVRREGRLAALISVPSEESEWAAPCSPAEEQAQRLTAEGFRVQWVREIRLAS